MDITTSDIRALMDEAGQAGDSAQVTLCEHALNGDGGAWDECERVITEARRNAITLTAQDIAVLRKLNAAPNMETSTSASGWQPLAGDVEVVNSLIERGVLEQRPGFSSVQWTRAGHDAFLDVIDRQH